MTPDYIIPLSDPAASLLLVGGKGASLAKLSAAGFPVPDGFHITTTAYMDYVTENKLQPDILRLLEALDLERPSTLETASEKIMAQFLAGKIPAAISDAVTAAYTRLAGQNPAVAVRSSATAEDLPEASFAGQQDTYLNISDPAALLEAVKKCWASLWTARAIDYRARRGITPDQVSLAVVVQLLVPAKAAGILFTANPVTGKRHQSIISAAWGLGEAVVGGSVTPDTFILDEPSGQILSREIHDKQVMTVRDAHGTREQPVPAHMRRTPALSDRQAGELARLGVQIEALYGMPMDIEWALTGNRFMILQARPITALPEAAPEEGLDWILPDPKGHYLRASICELMPDPLSPLFDTLGMQKIEKGIIEMARILFHLPPDTLPGFMVTVNGYAYQKLSFTRRQWASLLFWMVPRMLHLLRAGVPFWQKVAFPRYADTVSRWQDQDISNHSAAEIWAGIHEIMSAFGFHLGALMASTMGPSAGSEGLFTQVYQKMIRKEGDPPAPAFLMGLDSIPAQAEKQLYDLALWCRDQEGLAAYLSATSVEQISSRLADERVPDAVPPEIWQSFQNRFYQYLREYGYSIYDMDFAKPLPADQPEPILETFKLFILGRGKNPYERQESFAQKREDAIATVRARTRGLKRWAFEKALHWAQSQAPLREDGIAQIGLGYPALRRMLLELGDRFVKAGALHQADDIFWLKEGEVDQLIARQIRHEAPEDFSATIQHRQALWEKQKRLIPPAQLPMGKKFIGMDMEGILAVGETLQEGDTIQGVGASPGQVRGVARVLHGPEDFDQMQPGDVLVATITTPAWTPLFAMASGIVTDIGGPLSHGSIVAREYGIPAVLGTGVATRRIQSGQTVMVDGNAGTVTLQKEEILST